MVIDDGYKSASRDCSVTCLGAPEAHNKSDHQKAKYDLQRKLNLLNYPDASLLEEQRPIGSEKKIYLV